MPTVEFKPLRSTPTAHKFSTNDYLVLFGEVFAKGYVNGIIAAAQKAGMKVIYSTVGRRGADGVLRELTAEEAQQATQNGGGPLINIPLEAGFDLHSAKSGITPCDQLKSVKMSEWQNARLNWDDIAESETLARTDFANRVQRYVQELERMIPAQSRVVIAHTMAGGVPRAKIFMPAMNRVFKGRGDRFSSSEAFTTCDMGRLALKNFDFVTADTFATLIQATENLRLRQTQNGGAVKYLAYGYHGTDIYFDNDYRWQTYTCYFQGWAKMRLESHAQAAFKKGIEACVFNCPEILTNSSSVFQGVEVSLYPFIAALRQKAGKNPLVEKALAHGQSLLKPEFTLDDVLKKTESYLTSPLAREFFTYSNWPRHNRADQMEHMLSASDELIGMHKDEKQLLTFSLSELIFQGTGQLMLDESYKIREPVWWLGHDVIADSLAL